MNTNTHEWNQSDKEHLSVQSALTVYEAVRAALSSARRSVITANVAMVTAYWEIGKQIFEAVGDRAEYGKRLLQFFSERLTKDFGKGFTERNLRAMRQFYETFPIRHTLRAELTWSKRNCGIAA